METFEFLSILKNHGMPSTMGVLTHLDYFKENKELRKTKKNMKKRFWKDVYDGAKLFYLSGVVFDRYPKIEIHNLARFISVAKHQPLSWRTKHAYLIADRFDVIQNIETKKDNAMVSFYGYVRGTYFEKNTKLHVMGIGDYHITSATRIQDPVPVEAKKPAGMSKAEFEKETGKKKRRTLKDKERILYAPFSSLGALNFDKTSGYITIPDKYVVFSKAEFDNTIPGNEGQKMVRELQDRKFQQEEQKGDDNLELLEGVNYQNEKETHQDKVKESKIRVVQSDGKVKEYSDRRDALVSKNEKEGENMESEFVKPESFKKLKTLSDLIYEESTSEDTSDTDINQLDSSNVKIGLDTSDKDLLQIL